MRDLNGFLSLPAALLCFTIASAEELQWPYNLPRTLKYYPKDEAHVKRGIEAQERLSWQSPTAVKKMGEDPGEKFYLDYWEFDTTYESYGMPRQPIYTHGNTSSTCMLLPPLAPHTNHERTPSLNILGRSLLPREFQCPSDTVSCSSIGSDLCCQSGETCVNTSEGVGCCPAGATCGDTVAGCDTAAGYTSCPDSANGGCCVPGAACLDTGCVLYGTQTVSVTLTTATITSGGTINPTTMTQSSQVPGSTVILTSSYTKTVTQQGTTVTQTVTAPVTITIQPSCTAGYFSCGNGCCPNGQGCASDDDDDRCPDLSTTTSATASPPVRPTTNAPSSDSSVSPADTNVPESTPATAGACPPYYYMCSARYLGGCCRVDRNCDTTSCPPTSVSDIVTSGLTIGVGQTPSGSCMTSWSSCASTDGGGCCPPGFACGAQCVAATGTQTAAKEAPTSSGTPSFGVERYVWSFVALGAVAAVGMICL